VPWDPLLNVYSLTQSLVQEFRETHARWLECRRGGEQRNATTAGDPVPGQVDTSASKSTASPLMLRDVELSSDTLIDGRDTTAASPTLSVSTISDLTPTELDSGESEPMLTRHNKFYVDDGNVEIMCGHTVFRIHSSIVSFSSSRLRNKLSPSTLLNAPTPKGCPRIVFNDSTEDFAVLLKMITTPG
jgi:hypothetical protein